MRGKLSQSTARPIVQPNRGGPPARQARNALTTLWLSFSLALATPFGLGCDDAGPGDRLSGGASTGPMSPSENGKAQTASFSWPEGPKHPVIGIEIEAPGLTGSLEIELMPELAPKTVAQVLEWVDDGFYDGTTFHRVIDGFMIQGGDPNSRDRDPRNDGQGGIGFNLEDEFSRAPFTRGVVGMGNTGHQNSAGSQFFIMQSDEPSLDGHYTAIGRVRSGMEIVDAIVRVETDKYGRWGPKNRPIENVVMARIARVEAGGQAGPVATRSEVLIPARNAPGLPVVSAP
jgi:peptidyl-prolyl cis-trans isomerase B (cyclophilin B)